MSSFTGVLVLDDDNRCTCETSGIHAGAGADIRYHLLLIKGYSGSKKELATSKSVGTETFVVGGHNWSIEYYPNGENQSCADLISLSLSRLYNE